MRASFSYEGGIDGYVVIRDNDNGGMSVTNDAEAVVKAVVAATSTDKPIVYRDSDGFYDALAHRAGRFTAFIPLGRTTSAERAVQALKNIGAKS